MFWVLATGAIADAGSFPGSQPGLAFAQPTRAALASLVDDPVTPRVRVRVVGSARRASPTLASPERGGVSSRSLERYDILAKLAEGGMGEVLLARATGEHGFRKLVAVKRIRPELAVDSEFLVRFVTEAKVTVSLSHANIVQVFDLARAGPDLFLVMEYVRGADLSLLLRRSREHREPLAVPLVLHLAAETLKGLAYAHGRSRSGTQGIIHCDISPSNILVSYSGEVKLADFGIAQAVARRQTDDGRILGKKEYMPPEQLAGQTLDARADLFALGRVLKAALQVGPDATEAPWPPPQVPAALVELLDRMTAAPREQRPSTATEVLKAVAELARVQGSVLTAPEVGSWAARLVPPPPEQDDEEFAKALGQVLGAAPQGGTGTQSKLASSVTFLSRALEDGTTVWEEAAGAARTASLHPSSELRGRRWRGRGPWVAAGALVLVTSGVGLWLAGRGAGPGGTAGGEGSVLPPPSAVAPPAQPVAPLQPDATAGAATTPAAGTPPPPERKAATRPASARPKSTAEASRRARTQRPAGSGFLNVFADPWANVFIDGRRVGTTPLRSLSLPVGSHRVRLEHPSRKAAERTVSISSGQTELLDVSLEAAAPATTTERTR